MRTWRMFGGRGTSRPEFLNVGDERTVRAYGREAVPVLVTEDPTGPYYGWISCRSDEPVMIQPHISLFTMQFPYGPRAAEEAGQGRIVRLRIEAAA